MLLGVTAAVIVLPTLVYVFGGPGARGAIDGFWRWFDGSLERLQVMSWVVAAAVAAVSYLNYLSTQSAQQLEHARSAVDRATEGEPEQQHVGRQALVDLQRSAEASGDQLPGFVDTAHTVTDTFKEEILTAAGKDPAAVEEIEGEAQPGGSAAVDGAQEGER
ncbi:hypothetical protein GCM10009767_02270 [Kocuria aegyptia]|uniref:Uncharacterized protein n=1 Tax=Kocuria aegyptia TaxID=330943 RepID=A0ABP4W560_9MICC